MLKGGGVSQSSLPHRIVIVPTWDLETPMLDRAQPNLAACFARVFCLRAGGLETHVFSNIVTSNIPSCLTWMICFPPGVLKHTCSNVVKSYIVLGYTKTVLFPTGGA
jgi:hypothetical protein